MKAFANYHPICLMIYFLSVIIIAMFVQNPVLQLSALFGAVLFCICLQRKKEILSGFYFYIPLFILVTLTNPLFSHNGVTPLFFLNGQAVTLEAFVYGVAIAVMVIGVMLWCRCYSEIMTSDKFLYLFGRVIPKLSLVLSMILRFIPQFKKQIKKVKNAQKTMGMYSSKSRVERINSSLKVFFVMISWSLENSFETSISMKARGYGVKKRTNYSIFTFSSNDVVLLSSTLLFLLITIVSVSIGKMDFWYYPSISEINVSVFSIITYISFFLLSFTPFFIEIKEAFKWKYYISKI